MNIDGDELKEVFDYIEKWHNSEYGLVITDVEVNDTLELVDLNLKGEYRVSCRGLFVGSNVFEDFYKRLLNACVSYGKDSALFEEAVRVVRDQLVEKFNDGLKIVDDEMTTVVDTFKEELLVKLREVELGSDIIVVLNFHTVIPVLVDDSVEFLMGLVD